MSAPAAPPRAIPSRAIRWWPLPVILVLGGAGIFCVRTFYGRQRQDQNLATAKIVILTFLLLFFWCLVCSRFRWKTRLAAAGGLFGLIALVPALFRIHGVSGDSSPFSNGVGKSHLPLCPSLRPKSLRATKPCRFSI